MCHFLNTMTANYEYSRGNRKNLPLPIQMQLSEKPKLLSQFSLTFLESTSNFEHFEKQKTIIAQVFLEVIDYERRVPKTTEICRKVLLSYFLIILRQFELRKVIFSQI